MGVKLDISTVPPTGMVRLLSRTLQKAHLLWIYHPFRIQRAKVRLAPFLSDFFPFQGWNRWNSMFQSAGLKKELNEWMFGNRTNYEELVKKWKQQLNPIHIWSTLKGWRWHGKWILVSRIAVASSRSWKKNLALKYSELGCEIHMSHRYDESKVLSIRLYLTCWRWSTTCGSQMATVLSMFHVCSSNESCEVLKL